VNYAHLFLTPNESNPLGVIGEVPGENGETIQGHTLVSLMAQVAKYPDAKDFLLHCEGPGGDVQAGDQMYDYLEALKAEGKRLDTITTGDIGSIMTKPFMAGQERTIGEGHKLYVHAPWVPHLEGNATEIASGLKGVYEEQEKLKKFYQLKTGLSDTGIKGIMTGSSSQDGTFINADQAVALKFATRKAPTKIKAFALIKNKNMSKETQTMGQKFGALLDMMLGNTAPVVPPAAATAPPAKAMVPLVMEGGMKLISSAEDPANLIGSTITDEAGQPLQDGPVKLTDGRTLILTGGTVAEVQPAAAAQADATAIAPVASATEIALQNQVQALTAELNTLKAVDVNAMVDQKIEAFKAEFPGVGKAPTKAINTNGAQSGYQGHKTIAMKQSEQREKRKQELLNRK
jgi:ATP-dependent protease ClpP protease subunit